MLTSVHTSTSLKGKKKINFLKTTFGKFYNFVKITRLIIHEKYSRKITDCLSLKFTLLREYY